MNLRAWHWIALVVCGAMTTLVVWQSRHASSHPETVVQQSPIVPASVPAEIAELREQTKDLARLRNEVMQLRANKRELDSARQQNVQLLAAQQTAAPTKRETPPGFTSKDKLANVGFATPDDTMQTFFWSLREGNYRVMIEAISPSDPERQRIEKMPPETFAKLEQKAARIPAEEMRHFTDFGIQSREAVTDDAVILHIGSSLSTNMMRFRFERRSDGWKLRAPFSP
ncbi:MAG TPA: hypothetical protein VK530_15100 [Candidatus Acidoferrum sp.]|nr:hypothetical protein [Candidatus Acidoferrum sp.]